MYSRLLPDKYYLALKDILIWISDKILNHLINILLMLVTWIKKPAPSYTTEVIAKRW